MHADQPQGRIDQRGDVAGQPEIGDRDPVVDFQVGDVDSDIRGERPGRRRHGEGAAGEVKFAPLLFDPFGDAGKPDVDGGFHRFVEVQL